MVFKNPMKVAIVIKADFIGNLRGGHGFLLK